MHVQFATVIVQSPCVLIRHLSKLSILKQHKMIRVGGQQETCLSASTLAHSKPKLHYMGCTANCNLLDCSNDDFNWEATSRLSTHLYNQRSSFLTTIMAALELTPVWDCQRQAVRTGEWYLQKQGW